MNLLKLFGFAPAGHSHALPVSSSTKSLGSFFVALLLAAVAFATITALTYTWSNGGSVTFKTSNVTNVGQYTWTATDGSIGSGDVSAANAALNSYNTFFGASCAGGIGPIPTPALAYIVESGGGNKQR